MGKVGQKEILTQKHVIQFFKNELASADFVDLVLLEDSLPPPPEEMS